MIRDDDFYEMIRAGKIAWVLFQLKIQLKKGILRIRVWVWFVPKYPRGLVKINLSTLLDIDMKVMFFLSPLCGKLPQVNAYVKYFDKNSK